MARGSGRRHRLRHPRRAYPHRPRKNAAAAENREPTSGVYGPNTCKQGFVWREAFDGDVVCVTPTCANKRGPTTPAADSRKQVNRSWFPPPPGPDRMPRDPYGVTRISTI